MALTVSLDDIVATGNSLLAIKPHWRRVRLGDVGQVLNGYAFKAELFTREGGMPLIRIRDVGSAASETFYSGDFDERYVVSAGDLLVGMDGDFNCARWRGPRSLLNQRVCKITVDDALYLPRFLDYTLPGYLKAINDATSSITVKHLSSRTIQDIPLPLPPMDEQREIVAELEKQFSRLDEAVANLQRVKANLKRYKASVLKAAVEGRLVETEASLAHREGRTFETGELLLQRIVGIKETNSTTQKRAIASEHIDCPEGWVRASIGEVSEFSFYGPRFSSDAYSDKGAFVLRTTDIDESGRVDTSKAPRIDLAAKDLAKYRVEPGDLLVTRTGSLGTVALFEDKVDAIPGAYLIQIRLRLDENSRRFLLMFLKSPEGQARLTGGGAGVGRQNLNAPTIAAIPFWLPPLAEQARVVAELDRHLSIIREVEAEVDANLQRAQALRQATLMKCFRIEPKIERV